MAYPPRFQFEPSSGSLTLSQTNNCGPTGAAQQIDYYLGREGTTRIEHLRSVAGVERGVPTNAWQQADMCTNMGVPCMVIEIHSMDQLTKIVGTEGRRPTGIGIQMSRLRAATRGHSFTGWHRVTLLKADTRKINGVKRRGFVYTDPNFNPPTRPDPKKGHRWINRQELEKAFVQNFPAYAIVPLKRKGA